MPRPDDEASGLGTTRLDEPTLSGEPKKEFDVFLGVLGMCSASVDDDVVDDDDDDDDDEYHYCFFSKWMENWWITTRPACFLDHLRFQKSHLT